MNLTFSKFKQLLFESLFNEDKSRLIDRLVLPDIENEEEKQKAKDEMKAFFKKYNTWENKLDWNKLKTITYADFEKIKNQASQTKGAQKREIASGDIKSIFKSVGNRKFEIVGENHKWLFIAPLTYEAAVYCDSSQNQGAGAKWCIGYEKTDDYWWEYVEHKESIFIMAFNKNYKSLSKDDLSINLKYMIEITKHGGINIWDQEDYKHTGTNMISKFADRDTIIQLSEKARSALKEEIRTANRDTGVDSDGVVRRVKNSCIKNKIYTPPKNAVAIDLSNFYWDTAIWEFNKIIIPENIMEIKDNCFDNWAATNKISFSPRTTPIKIGYKAFAEMEELNEIHFPSTAILDKNVLTNDTTLIKIFVPKKYTENQKVLKQTLGKIDYKNVKIISV